MVHPVVGATHVLGQMHVPPVLYHGDNIVYEMSVPRGWEAERGILVKSCEAQTEEEESIAVAFELDGNLFELHTMLLRMLNANKKSCVVNNNTWC